jgi:amino acid adenylation domain-containing protein
MNAEPPYEIEALGPAESPELPATALQRAMLRHARANPSDGVNVQQCIVTLREQLQPFALQSAWDFVIGNRDALRMHFPSNGEAPAIGDSATLPWRVEDLQPFVPAELEKLEEFLAADRATPFDFSQPPLSRVSLFQIGATEWRMVWTFHHIVLDGRSAGMVLREVFQIYRCLLDGHSPEIPAVTGFAAYLESRRAIGDSGDEAFWRSELSGIKQGTSLDIPLQLASPSGMRAGRVPKDVTSRLKELAAANECSLATIVHGAWALLLARHAGCEDVVFGEVRSCRPPEARDVAGMCVNTVPLRINVAGEMPLSQWLRGIHEKRRRIRAHEQADLASIQQWAGVGELVRSVVMFDHSTFDASVRRDMEGGASRRFEMRSDTGLPLTLWIYGGDEITFRIQARPALPVAALALVVRRFVSALQSIADATAGAVLSDISMADAAEKKQIAEWSVGEQSPIAERTLDSLFSEQLAARGEALAVAWAAGAITYQQLHKRALYLAAKLPAGQTVAVVMEKGWEQIVAVIAIHYAGSAYVPADASLPPIRRNAILGKAGVSVAIIQNTVSTESWPESVAPITITPDESDGPVPSRSKPDDLAYVIFTSGSTGEPKGVMIDHRSAVNTCLDVNRRHRVVPQDRILGLSALSFDLSVWDIFGTLAAGATLVLPNAESLREPGHWADLVRAEQITIWNSVPALLRLYVDFLELHPETAPRSLRAAFLSGDWIPLDLPARFKNFVPSAEVTSMGGATEGAIWSIDFPISKVEPHWRSIPYGRPMANQCIYILDAWKSPCEPLVVGQIYIGGAGVALGYWADPARTDEQFVRHPKTGERIYKTGDLGRWLLDGTVEFLGREDFQVKVQGFRIELEEIEATLANHPAITSAVVVARGSRDGERQLASYAVCRAGQSIGAGDLRAYVRERLPAYMVPGTFTMLPALPLTENGKLDRVSLPEPDETPQDSLEHLDPLVAIASEVLRRDGLSDDANLLHLGVSSMEMIRLASEIERHFGIRPKLADLYKNPTLSFIRALLPEVAPEAVPVRSEVSEFSGELPLSPAQKALFLLEEMAPTQTAYNIPMAWRISGEIARAALRIALGKLVRRHAALRSHPARNAEGAPVQIVVPAAEIEMSSIWSESDYSSLTAAEAEASVKARFKTEQTKRFDLSSAPLIRVSLLKVPHGEHVLIITFHHLITDAHSLSLLFGELVHLYKAAMEGRDADLPAPGDFPAAMRRCSLPDIDWWRGYLADAPPALDYPADHARPASVQYRGSTVEFELPVDIVLAARALARHARTTLYPVMFAAFAAVLKRSTGCEDLVVGTASRNREFPDSERVAGFFTEVLPTRLRVAGETAFSDLVTAAHESIGDTLAHDNASLEALIEGLNPPSDPSRNPFFQHLFVFVTDPADEILKIGTGIVEPLRFEGVTSKFDFSLFLTLKRDGNLRGVLEYNTGLFEQVTAHRLASRFVTFVSDAVASPARQVNDLRLMGDMELVAISSWSRAKEIRLLDEQECDVPVGLVGRIHDKDGSHGQARWRADGALEIILPEGDAQSSTQTEEAEYLASQNLLQTQILEIWESVLEKRPIGVRDHFFRIGGRSLSAVKMLGLVGEKLGLKIEPPEFFENPTIEALATSMRAKNGTGEPWVRLNSSGKRPPLVFLHGDFCGGFYTQQLADDLGGDQPVIAIHPHGTTGGAMPGSIREMAEDRLAALKKAGISGPIVLGGYCNGAFVALEMGRQMEKAGEKPPLVIMIMADGSNLRFRGANRLVRSLSFASDEATKEQRFLRMRNRISFLSAAAQKFGALPIGEKVKRLSRKITGARKVDDQSATIPAPPAEPPSPQQFGALASIYIRAIEGYAPSGYGGKIVCLWPKDEPGEWHAKDPTRGWSDVAEEVDGFVVPGDHFTVISDPSNLSAVAVRIREILGF